MSNRLIIDEKDPLIPAKEVQEKFGWSDVVFWTIRVKKRQLAYHKIAGKVFVRQSDLDAYLESCRTPAKMAA